MLYSGQITFSRSDLIRDVRAAGVEAGDVLVVHSSLRRVGWIDGGPREMVRALEEVLTEEGTLVMPTFSFNMTGWDMPPFDPWRTSSRVGLLTEVFWRSPGVPRSCHPTHSVAAWGALARRLTGGPIDYEPLGVGSPLDRAREAGAKILLLGVGQDRNSTVHLAESIAAMPYLRVPFTFDADCDEAFFYGEKRGRADLLEIREMPGSSECFEVLDPMLAKLGVTRRIRIGGAESTIMSSQELCDTVAGLLDEDPLLLLRSTDPSPVTVRRREFMENEMLRRPLAP